MLHKFGLKAIVFLLVLAALTITQQTDASLFSDIKLWYSEKAEINKHSRIIGNEVKTLYRERKAIQNFSEGTAGLVKAYQAIKNKQQKTSLPQLLDIARSITQAVSAFNSLAPKIEAMYTNAQPSMSYFSELTDKTETIQTSKQKILVKTFSDNRLNKLAGSNGWNRVFSSIKSDPLNIFRWGKLSDEYKLGKIEAQYPLKCAQIAFEATAYYTAAKNSIQELLSIQKEIKGIVGGDLSAILNMAGTIEKIQNSGNSIESLGELAEKGANSLTGRFSELLKIQETYVAANKAYNEKYNKSDGQTSTATTSATTSQNQKTISSTTPTSNTSGSSNITLKKAMENYQKAYEAYVEIYQKSGFTQAELNKAMSDLQNAKKQLEQAKAAQ